MNQAANQPGEGNNTLTSQQASRTNPFTADLKGEFTSNFGTNTNAVSQIFKEGGFAGGNDKKKLYMAIGLVVIVLGLVAFVVMSDMDDSSSDDNLAADGEDGSAANHSGSGSAQA